MRPKFYRFVSGVNHKKTKEQDLFKKLLRGRRAGKILLRSNTNCYKYGGVWECFEL